MTVSTEASQGISIETGTDTVLAEIVDGVGVVTLNRAERRNALHADMYDAVPAVLEQFIDRDDVGAILITGAGNAFCAGGDVRDGRKRAEPGPDGVVRKPTVEERTEGLAHNARMVQLLHSGPKVTIAALPGGAVGAGMSIALSTDLRISGRSGKLIPGWGKLAFSGDFGGTWFLSRLVGPSKALELLLDGGPITAEKGLELGLINKVVDDADLQTAALDWARKIAAGPRSAWGQMKANVLQAGPLSLAEALPLESERMVRSGLTDEHKDAVRAWMAEAAAKKTS